MSHDTTPGPDGLRVIAVDMDGTFLGPGSEFDRHRFAPLRRRMRQKDVRFVVASGNQEAQLLAYFADETEGVELTPDGVVSDNGAVVLAGNQRLLETEMDGPALSHAVSFLDRVEGLSFITSGPDGALMRDSEPEEMKQLLTFYHPQYRLVSTAEEMKGTRVSKIALVDLDGFSPTFMRSLTEALGESIIPVGSGHESVDLIVPGRHKASGLDVLLRHWGVVPEQVAAFGDSDNDVEMLAHVGAGVAMAEASERASSVAALRAPSNASGGVLTVLESWYPA